jgi:hypothetical protein
MRCKAGLFSRPVDVFLPTSISGLTAWFDASDAATIFDQSIGGSATAPDGQVGRLQDKSGNGRNFVQATSADRPTRKTNVQNGLDVIRFDGSGDHMNMSALMSNLITASSSTVFIVARAATVTTNEADIFDNQLLLGDNGLWHGFFVLKSNGTASAFGYNGDVPDPTATVSYTPPAWVVFAVRHNGTNLSARINGGTPASAALATRQELGNAPVLGITTDASEPSYTKKFFDGDLAELLIYNVALSESDQDVVEGYLADKWGIS